MAITMEGEMLTLRFEQDEADLGDAYVLRIVVPTDRITVRRDEEIGETTISVHGYHEANDFLNACGLIFDLALKNKKH